MGSLSAAYYTIAPISLDLLRPALLLEIKNTRSGAPGPDRTDVIPALKVRCLTSWPQAHILPVRCSRPRKHFEPKGQATPTAINRKRIISQQTAEIATSMNDK